MVKAEHMGTPSVAIVLPNFEKHARREAGLHGLPDLRIVVPTAVSLGDTLVDAEQIRLLAEAVVPELARLLVEGQ